jgi:hypothetical protein
MKEKSWDEPGSHFKILRGAFRVKRCFEHILMNEYAKILEHAMTFHEHLQE